MNAQAYVNGDSGSGIMDERFLLERVSFYRHLLEELDHCEYGRKADIYYGCSAALQQYKRLLAAQTLGRHYPL